MASCPSPNSPTDFSDEPNIYAWSVDRHGLDSGWWALGTWMAGGQAYAPKLVSVVPATGSGSSQTFTFTVSDNDGYADIDTLWVIVNTTIVSSQGCFVIYHQADGTLSLATDSGVGTVGPGIPGGAGTLENSQCALNLVGASVARSGNALTLALPLTFKTAFAGSKNVYAWSVDHHSLNSGWSQLGTWLVR